MELNERVNISRTALRTRTGLLLAVDQAECPGVGQCDLGSLDSTLSQSDVWLRACLGLRNPQRNKEISTAKQATYVG